MMFSGYSLYTGACCGSMSCPQLWGVQTWALPARVIVWQGQKARYHDIIVLHEKPQGRPSLLRANSAQAP